MVELELDERALQDIEEIWLHYLEQASLTVAERFTESFWSNLEFLRRQPLIGKILENDIRQWYVGDFPYLIIYQTLKGVIRVFHILHESRDPSLKTERF